MPHTQPDHSIDNILAFKSLGFQKFFLLFIQLRVIGNILIGGQQEATCAAGRVYVPADFNTKEKALSGIYAPKKA
jgi:hypothetical protein